MESAAIRLMIVDDEPALGSAWERFLQMQPDMECVGTLRRADALVAAISENRPDVVLLDVQLPGRDPFEALREVVSDHPEVRIIFYSGRNDDQTIGRALDGGAWGMVDKVMPPRDILEVIRRVSSGERCFPPHRR